MKERSEGEEGREKTAVEEQRTKVVEELDLEEGQQVRLLLVKVLLEEGVVVVVQTVLKLQQLAAAVLWEGVALELQEQVVR